MKSKLEARQLRVVMLGHKRVPGREGGVEVVVEELGTRMVMRGVKVTLINRRRHGIPRIRDYAGARIRWAPTVERSSLNAVVYAFFAMLIASFSRSDVIHIHAEGSCTMLPIAKLLRKRTVATIHGLDWQRSKWGGFAKAFLRLGERCAARYADEVIVLSADVKRYFLEQYNRETRLIGNGVSPAIYRPARVIREKWGLEADGYILFMARIVPEKDLHNLLDAFLMIDTDKKLAVAGDFGGDEYARSIQQMATRDPRVVLTGFASGEVLDELYSNCFLYTLPSRVEGMSMSLLEAMSHGCFCLTSDIPENRDVLGGAGIVFQAGSVQSLRVALEGALTDGRREAFEAAAQERSKSFTWDAVVDQTLALYDAGATGAHQADGGVHFG